MTPVGCPPPYAGEDRAVVPDREAHLQTVGEGASTPAWENLTPGRGAGAQADQEEEEVDMLGLEGAFDLETDKGGGGVAPGYEQGLPQDALAASAPRPRALHHALPGEVRRALARLQQRCGRGGELPPRSTYGGAGVPWPRIYRQPLRRGGHVVLDLCMPQSAATSDARGDEGAPLVGGSAVTTGRLERQVGTVRHAITRIDALCVCVCASQALGHLHLASAIWDQGYPTCPLCTHPLRPAGQGRG